MTPHMCESLYRDVVSHGEKAYESTWPTYDEKLCVSDEIEIAVQLMGKVKARIMVASDVTEADAIASAKQAISAELSGKNIVKEIYVPGRLVNIVAK